MVDKVTSPADLFIVMVITMVIVLVTVSDLIKGTLGGDSAIMTLGVVTEIDSCYIGSEGLCCCFWLFSLCLAVVDYLIAKYLAALKSTFTLWPSTWS